MQAHVYAFIPFGVLVATAVIAAVTTLWTQLNPVPGVSKLAIMPRPTAEILQFPVRPILVANTRANTGAAERAS
jgi:hypothetical protein